MIIDKKRPIERGEQIKNLDTGFQLVETNARCFYNVCGRKLKIDFSLFPVLTFAQICLSSKNSKKRDHHTDAKEDVFPSFTNNASNFFVSRPRQFSYF